LFSKKRKILFFTNKKAQGEMGKIMFCPPPEQKEKRDHLFYSGKGRREGGKAGKRRLSSFTTRQG